MLSLRSEGTKGEADWGTGTASCSNVVRCEVFRGLGVPIYWPCLEARTAETLRMPQGQPFDFEPPHHGGHVDLLRRGQRVSPCTELIRVFDVPCHRRHIPLQAYGCKPVWLAWRGLRAATRWPLLLSPAYWPGKALSWR